MSIETIQQKNFAAGQIAEADVSSGEKLQAQALSSFGQGLANVGQAFNALRLRQEKLRNMQFETDLALYDKEFKSKLSSVEWDKTDAQSLIKEYEKGIDALGGEKLGKDGYQNWSKERGYGFKETASLSLAEDIAGRQDKYNYAKLNEIGAQKAVLAVNSPEEAQGIINDFFGDIEESVGDVSLKQKIKENFKGEYALAQALRDIETKTSAALKKLKNEKEYDGLGAVQRERLLKQAQARLKAVEGTALQEKVKASVSAWNELYNTDYEKAVKYYEAYAKTLNQKQAAGDGLTRLEASAFLDYMEGVLGKDISYTASKNNLERQNNIAKEMSWQEFKTDFNSFDWDKKSGRALNEDLASLSGVTSFIEKIDAALENGLFPQSHNDELLQMRGKLAFELGQIIMQGDKRTKSKADKIFFRNSAKQKVEEPYIDNSGLIPRMIYRDFSNEEYLKAELKNIAQNKGMFNALSGGDNAVGTKNLGLLYQSAYRTLRQKGVDLKSASFKGKTAAQNVVHELYRQMVRTQNNLPPGEYQAALVGENIILLNKDGSPQGIEIEEYKKGL